MEAEWVFTDYKNKMVFNFFISYLLLNSQTYSIPVLLNIRLRYYPSFIPGFFGDGQQFLFSFSQIISQKWITTDH